MNNLKKNVTPIEDLITEDFGPIGSAERDQFELDCANWLLKTDFSTDSEKDE